MRRRDAPGTVAPHGPHAPPRRHDLTRPAAAALLAAGSLLTAGCGGEATVVTDEPAPAPTYQPAPTRPAPAPRRERRSSPAPPAPLVVRDASEEPEAVPDPPEAAPAVEPPGEVVQDDAYRERLWATLPAPLAPLPPPLKPLPTEEVGRLRAELLAYLREASGPHRLPKRTPEEGAPLDYTPNVNQYLAFQGEYGKHKPEIHGLIERDLWLAEKLLAQEDRAVRDSGLGLVRWVMIAAEDWIEDGRLAAAIAEIYVVPRLESAEPGAVTFVSRQHLLTAVKSALVAGESWERAGRACGEMLRLLSHNRNQSDAWRASLAKALSKQGRHDEAVAVLNDMHDPTLTSVRDHHLSVVDEAKQNAPSVDQTTE